MMSRKKTLSRKKVQEQHALLFGTLGKVLLILSLLLILATAYFLPTLLVASNLSMPAKWASVTRIVIQITIGSWVATVVMSIANVIVWLRAVFVITDGEQYAHERRDVTYVRNFTLWFLGIMTALSAYIVTWLSG
jgi:hypothetical protein